jgi:hypothetical protein
MPHLDRTDIIALLELLTAARTYCEAKGDLDLDNDYAALEAAVSNCEHIDLEAVA